MATEEKILTYLSIYGKENKYRLASAFKIGVDEVTRALSTLEKEGRVEIKGGRAILVKGKKPIITKARKRKKQPKLKKEEPKEEKSEVEPEKEQPEETPTEEQVEQPEETEKVEETPTEEEPAPSEEPTEEEVKETFGVKTEEEKLEGTVKFYNPHKGFGFIIGDDGKEYYVHKSGLKEGVTIEADNRVSFKVVQGDKGPKAEEVEWISQA